MVDVLSQLKTCAKFYLPNIVKNNQFKNVLTNYVIRLFTINNKLFNFQ